MDWIYNFGILPFYICERSTCSGHIWFSCVKHLQAGIDLLDCLAFQYFDCECSWWLFQKLINCTKSDNIATKCLFFCREMRFSHVIFLVDYLKQYFTVLQFYFSCWSSTQPSRLVLSVCRQQQPAKFVCSSKLCAILIWCPSNALNPNPW